MLVGTIDYCFRWQCNDKSKFRGRQKLAAIIICVVSSTFVPFSPKKTFTHPSFSSYYYCSRGIAVATIAASKWVVIPLVEVSLTACRRVTYDLNVCPWWNENIITIAMTSVYHCNYDNRRQLYLMLWMSSQNAVENWVGMRSQLYSCRLFTTVNIVTIFNNISFLVLHLQSHI